MMPGNPAGRGLRLPDLRRRSGRPRSTSGCRSSFHILTSRDDALAAAAGPSSTASCRSSAATRTSWACSSSAACSSATPQLKVVCVEADAGWAPHLHVPHGPRLRAPPLLAHRGHDLEAAVASTSASTSTLTFQDDWVAFKMTRPVQLAPPDVGQRLPAQRFDLAVVAGDARRAHGAPDRGGEEPDPPRQRRRALPLEPVTRRGIRDGAGPARARPRKSATEEEPRRRRARWRA